MPVVPQREDMAFACRVRRQYVRLAKFHKPKTFHDRLRLARAAYGLVKNNQDGEQE